MSNEDLPEPEFADDEDELTYCPACGREYDEIDIDYLICSRCGWDETAKKYRPQNIDLNGLTDD